jgi:hypothetical protein
MEGTRNEKIVIVLSAYVIGFTTAFIAFGIHNPSETQISDNSFNRSYAQPLSATEDIGTISSIEKNDEGLFAVTRGYSRLLSVKRGSQGATLIAATPTPGFHAAVIADALSKDAKFIYFCEQQTADAKECIAYVYSLADDSLHRVKVNGEAYAPSVESQTAVWTDDSKLALNNMLSNSPEKPWEFTVTQEATRDTVEPVASSNNTQIVPSEMPVDTQEESIPQEPEKLQLQ